MPELDGLSQCCLEKKEGGINLINPDDAVAALMTKWVIKAMEPNQSNLHLLLRFKLSQYQPYSGGRWMESLDYFPIQKHQARNGSIVWNRVAAAWKTLLPSIKTVTPRNWEELMSTSWWCYPLVPMIGPGFSRAMAATLHIAGLRTYRDAWYRGRLMTAEEAKTAFGLWPDSEFGAWSSAIQRLKATWGKLLQPRRIPISGEWIAIYEDNLAQIAVFVCFASKDFEPTPGPG